MRARFQMIRRSALEKMIAAYPKTHFSRVHSCLCQARGARRRRVPISLRSSIASSTRDWRYLSEDYSFCLRWRRIGGEIWLDAASKLTHCGPYEFVGDHTSRFYGVTRSKIRRRPAIIIH